MPIGGFMGELHIASWVFYTLEVTHFYEKLIFWKVLVFTVNDFFEGTKFFVVFNLKNLSDQEKSYKPLGVFKVLQFYFVSLSNKIC